MVAGGPPSTPLFGQAQGVDTGMRRHDRLSLPRVKLKADWYQLVRL
jgi:hypothetical protein